MNNKGSAGESRGPADPSSKDEITLPQGGFGDSQGKMQPKKEIEGQPPYQTRNGERGGKRRKFHLSKLVGLIIFVSSSVNGLHTTPATVKKTSLRKQGAEDRAGKIQLMGKKS